MLPTTSAVQGQFPSQTLEGGGVPAASAHHIDGRLCGSVLDLLMQGHRLKVPDSELFAGAFEMLATGRDDGLHEAMKRASETAGGGATCRSATLHCGDPGAHPGSRAGIRGEGLR